MKQFLSLFVILLIFSCSSTKEAAETENVDSVKINHLEANNAFLVEELKATKEELSQLKKKERRELRQIKRDSIKDVRAEIARNETNFVRSYKTGTKMLVGVGAFLFIQAITKQ